jgi:tetratricopeptide (TPR) repeat protein
LLRRRVSSLAVGDDLDQDEADRRAAEAGRLAAVLGGLPIATECAAAYLAATDQSASEYVIGLEEYLGWIDEQPSEFPAPILAAWDMSVTLLNEDAGHLFYLCAFFSPEPIAAELLLQNAEAVTGPPGLADVLLDSRRFRAAAARLARLSLVKVDGARDVIQMHRVVQAVTKWRLRQDREDVFFAYRAAADSLLAESDPGNPDRGAGDVTYDLSLQHLESDRTFFNTENPALRELIIHQVRRLHLRGGHVEAMQFGKDALGVWRDRLGHDDLQVLSLAVEVAIAMRWDGHAADARDLIEVTLRLLQDRYGDEHEVTLLCANTRGADLRTHSQFTEALKLDLSLLPKFERVFGIDHDRTLNVRNNLGADYRRLGRFREALQTDRRTLDDRVRILGPNDLRTLTSYDAVARDLRGLGQYQESLDIARKVIEGFASIGGRENLDLLSARKGFAAALRKVGYPEDSLQESEDVVQRYLDYLGPEHTYTLRAAANLINDRRAAGDLARAEELAREVLDRCQEAGHPPDLSYGTMVNLASVLRASGRAQEARRLDLHAWHRFTDTYGDLHPFALEASINCASDLAVLGDLAGAIRIGRETLAKCEASLGETHPDTLMAAANLALDEAAAGNREQAGRLLADALRSYEETLTTEHPEAQAAARRIRLPRRSSHGKPVQVPAHPVADVGDEPQQIGTVDRGIAEADPAPVAMRVQAATADLQHRTALAARRQRAGPELPRHGGGVIQHGIEGVGEDVPPGVGGAGIGRAQRVELLDGPVRLDDDQRAGRQPEPFHRTGLTQDELDHFAEHADPGLLNGRGVPAFEHRDQPVGVARAGRRAAPVRVRKEQVQGWRMKLEQRLVRGDRIVVHVNGAQDAVVDVAVAGRAEQGQAVGHVGEAVAAVGVDPVAAGGLGVAVQADTDPDAKFPQHVQ